MVPVASVITVAFMGSVIVTPLYTLYQAKFGFSAIVLTLIYAVYVVGNVTALLAFGQVSDQVGRKRVVLPGLAVAAASGLVFLFAAGTAWLFVARLLTGVAVGILSGTATAWVAERLGAGDRSGATVTAATANLVGIAIGPLLGGVLAQYVAHPLRIPLLAYLAIVVAVAVAVARVPDERKQQVGWRDVRIEPRVGVPADQRRAFAAPGICGFVTFALGGLYFGLIPAIVIRDLHNDNLAVGGLIVTELAAIGAVLIVLGRRLAPLTAMRSGLAALMPAVALIVVAQAAGSLVVLVIATALAGVTLSLGYRGSLQIVNEIAPDERRAEMVSSYYIACFVGNSVPVIGVGVLSTLTDRLAATGVFAAVVAVLALSALKAGATNLEPEHRSAHSG